MHGHWGGGAILGSLLFLACTPQAVPTSVAPRASVSPRSSPSESPVPNLLSPAPLAPNSSTAAPLVRPELPPRPTEPVDLVRQFILAIALSDAKLLEPTTITLRPDEVQELVGGAKSSVASEVVRRNVARMMIRQMREGETCSTSPDSFMVVPQEDPARPRAWVVVEEVKQPFGLFQRDGRWYIDPFPTKRAREYAEEAYFKSTGERNPAEEPKRRGPYGG